MKIIFTSRGWGDYLWWQTNDRKTLKRINLLINDAVRNGHQGVGKPEPLRHDLSGYWSRRITSEHRLVYALDDDAVIVVACRYHYHDD